MPRGRGSRGQPPQGASQPGPSRGNGRGRGPSRGRGRGRGRPSNSFGGDMLDDLDGGSMFPSNRNTFPSFAGDPDVMVLEFENQHLLNFPASKQRNGPINNAPVGRGRGAPPEEYISHSYLHTHGRGRGLESNLLVRGRGLEINSFVRGRGSPGNRGRDAGLRGHGFPSSRGRGVANANRGARRGSGLGFNTNITHPNPYDIYGEYGRPLLKPVVFVKAKQKLFEREEEILEAALVKTADDMEDPDMNPVAEQVAKVFAAGDEGNAEGVDEGDSSDSEEEAEGEDPEVISIQEDVTLIETTQSTTDVGGRVDIFREFATLFIDAQPSSVNDAISVGEKATSALPLADEEDEIILFEPLNRVVRKMESPISPKNPPEPPVVAFESLSLDFTRGSVPSSVLNLPEISALHPKLRPRERKIAKRERRAARRKQQRETYGSLKPRAPRTNDSDLEWGSDGPPSEGHHEDEATQDANDHGMQVDEDMDGAAYTRMVIGMANRQSQNPTTIDDLAVEAKIKEEEEEEAQEDRGQWDDEDEETSDSDASSDGSETKGFRTRLEKMRGTAKDSIFLEDDDGVDRHAYPWAGADEIQRILDKDSDILEGRDRKQTKMLLKAITLSASTTVHINKKKGDHIPVELQAQWQKDRQKKAEWKRERELKQIEATKGIGAKGKKKEGKQTAPPGSVAALEPLLRRFHRDLSQDSITLPEFDKETRVKVHLMAKCFNLQSKSLGSSKKDEKVMVLTKTTKTGLSVDEKRLSAILQADREGGVVPARFQKWGNRGGGKGHPLRQKDGDIIGKRAEKIGTDNVGYKILQGMGWSEGGRIGKTGGLIAPVIAVIKNTKLGLGATR